MEKNKLVINVNIVILSTKIKDLSDGLKKEWRWQKKEWNLINIHRNYLILITEKKLKHNVSETWKSISKSLIHVSRVIGKVNKKIEQVLQELMLKISQIWWKK